MQYKFSLKNELDMLGDTDNISVTHRVLPGPDNFDAIIFAFKRFMVLTGFTPNMVNSYVRTTAFENSVLEGQGEFDEDEEQITEPQTETKGVVEMKIEEIMKNGESFKKFKETLLSNETFAASMFQLYLEDTLDDD